jgi:DNA-binding transcriptional LysR family regulator
MKEWELKKLHILRALHDAGTVTAAAAALRMTPSAVSQQLAVLAKQIGTPVVEAHGRGVRLTGAAHVLLRHAEVVFAQLERAGAELEGYARGDAGLVTIGTIATAISRLVVPAAELLRRSAPAVTVSVREVEAAAVFEELAAGAVDIAVSLAVDAPTARDPRFTVFPLLTDPLDIALPIGHPLAAEPGLRLAALAEEPWIFGSAGPWRTLTLAACADAGFVPEQAHAASDWPAIFSLVSAGLGIALVPQMAAVGGWRREVAVRPLDVDRPVRRIVAAVRAGTEDAALVRRAMGALRHAAELDPTVKLS